MIKTSVTTSDIVQDRLNYLHSTSGLSWREIARLDDYSGIPAGTLSAIARGYPVPHKWLHRLGLPETKPAPVCRFCGEVHVSSRCPVKPPSRRRNRGSIVIRGEERKVISYRRHMDNTRPFAPVLVVVESET